MSSAQTHNAGPSKVSKSKRILSDSEDTSERETSRVREAKRPRHADSLIDIDQKRTTMDKDKKKRRKRKRKQSIVQSQNVLLGAGGALNAVTAQAAGHSRTRSEPPTARRRSVSPRAGLLDVLLPKISRQTSVGLSSVTLGSQSPEVQPKEISTNDKGKARASPELERPPTGSAAGITDLTTQLTAKTDLVGKHTALLTTLQQSLTCQICLDLMHRPYALAPCGHTACYDCLLSWFRAPPADIPPEEATQPWMRKKTCPHCRAIITERPVEIWTIKDMVNAIVRSDLVELPASAPAPAAESSNTNADPWENIFRRATAANTNAQRQTMGIHDPDDGGVWRCEDCLHEIWDGFCSSCGRMYTGHLPWPQDPADDDSEYDHQELWDDDGDLGAAWIDMGPLGGLGALGWGYGYSEDDEDGSVSRDSGSDEDEGHDVALPPRRGRRRYSPVREAAEEHERADSEEDGSYESSFIDDEDDVRPTWLYNPLLRPWTPEQEPSYDDHNEESSRSLNARVGSRAATRVVSSEEEEEEASDAPAQHPGRVQRRATQLVIHSDEEEGNDREAFAEEEEEDGDLADIVAAREREIYGDDGSVPHSRYEHGLDEDDENEDISDAQGTWSDGYDPAPPGAYGDEDESRAYLFSDEDEYEY